MTVAICDASVVVKWFADEQDSDAARRIARCAIKPGRLHLHCLELTLYEVGSACIQAGEASAIPTRLEHVVGQMSQIHVLDPTLAGPTAGLATRHDLTFYDAAYLALATALHAPLITADKELLAAGALTATDFADAL